MRRFRILFILFAVALLAPLAFLVRRALHSVALERQLHHQVVAERVFDEMERGLSRLLEREEQHPFDTYGRDADAAQWPFVVGHFQIEPDGRIRALTAENDQRTNADEIERRVGNYWRSARGAQEEAAVVAQLPGTTIDLEDAGGAGARAQPRAGKLEQKKDVSAYDVLRSLNKGALERNERQREAPSTLETDNLAAARGVSRDMKVEGRAAPAPGMVARLAPPSAVADSAAVEADMPSMSGRVVDERYLLLYRTVLHGRQGYQQGVLIDLGGLGDWLREQGLGGDGLAEHARMTVFATPAGGAAAGDADAAAYVYQHRFAEPFDDLSARLVLQPLPGIGNSAYVYTLAALVLVTGSLGLLALYRMVSVVVSFAERRSNFVAAVSHELKTPLTAIRMYGEMLRDGLVSSEAKRDEYHRHITVESERLSRLINNVLEFARLEKGTRDMALTTGSVAPVLREVADLMRPHVEGQGFELALELEDGLPPVRFEPDALMQVLWNLVDNAVKYARDASPKRIALRCWGDAAGVHAAVRDHGPGVAARHLGKIFEPFYRGESELTRRNKGTGLGLALVRGLVERMQATAQGRNLPEGGFEVEILFRPAV